METDRYCFARERRVTGRYCSGMLLLFVLVSGCTNTVDIDARDQVNFANLEVVVPVNESESLQLRLQASGADGEFKQTLDDDERVEIDDTEIDGPAELAGELDLRYYTLALGWNHLLGAENAFRFSYFFGLSQTDFKLLLEGRDERIRERDGNAGLYAQYALDYAATESLNLGFSVALSVGDEFTLFSELDLKAQYALWEHLHLSAGYRWFDYEFEDALFESNVRINYHGPFVGLRLQF